jgi:hypothetical protein
VSSNVGGLVAIALVLFLLVAIGVGIARCIIWRQQCRRRRADIEEAAHAAHALSPQYDTKPAPVAVSFPSARPSPSCLAPQQEQESLAIQVAFPDANNERSSDMLATPITDETRQVRTQQAAMLEKNARWAEEENTAGASSTSGAGAVPEDYEMLKEEVAQLRLHLHKIAAQDDAGREEKGSPPAYDAGP